MRASRGIAYNSVIQMIGRAISLGISLLTLRLMTTYLGTAGFGEYAIVLAISGTVVVAAELGVTSVLTRELSKFPDQADHFGGVLLGFRLVTALIAAIAMLVVIPFLPYNSETKVALAISAPGVFFLILGGLPTAFFTANMRFSFVAALDVAARVLGLAGIVLVRILGLGIDALVAFAAASYFICFLAAFLLSLRFWRLNVSFDWQAAKPLVRASVGVGFASTVGLLVYRGDAILLSLLKTSHAVGIYTVAYRFLDQSFLITGILIGTIFPVMTRAMHSDDEAANRIINRSFEVLALLGGAATIFVYVLAPDLIRVVAGDQFKASVRTLQILSLAIVALFTAPVFYNVLVAKNWQRDLIRIGVALLVWDVSTNLVLIPRFSYTGAAVATVGTQTLGLVIIYTAARRRHPFRLDPGFLARAGGAGAVAAFVVIGLNGYPSWAVFVVAELAFCGGAVLLKAIRPTDLRSAFALTGWATHGRNG